ncbi:MAG: hypothetical protein V2J24_00570 [Pseudomonadales bacterium]|nr:hypothetical protein [Pseudomonadales bacterium]
MAETVDVYWSFRSPCSYRVTPDLGRLREEIERNQETLEAAGHWGVATMVLRNEPFFGQDRIDTLRWRLDQHGLRRA